METLKNIPGNQDKVSEISLAYKSKVKAEDRPLVNSPELAYGILLQYWNRDTIELLEEFKILLLNHAKRVIGLMEIGTGGLNSVVIDTRLIFMAALKTNAHFIILSHNHPSHNLRPSEADRQITNRIVKCGELMDINILDHLIITPHSFYSFAENGDM